MSNRNNKGRPVHQNKFAFKHNPNSKKTDRILSSPNEGVCQNCFDKIEWRKRYRKYKPLTAPANCVGCEKKTVRIAYHIQCFECATENELCAVCKKAPIVKPYQVLDPTAVDEYGIRVSAMSQSQRKAFLDSQKPRSKKKGTSTKRLDDSDDIDISAGDSDDDETLGPIAKAPKRKLDESAFAALIGQTTLDPLPQPSQENEKSSDSDDISGSIESFEDDSEEIKKVTKETRKIAEQASALDETDTEEDDEQSDLAGSDEEDIPE